MGKRKNVLKFSSSLEKRVYDIIVDIFKNTLFRIFLHYYIPDIDMQVDIAIPELHLAIEVQGEQHRNREHYFNKVKTGWDRQQTRDTLLKQILSDNGWRVIEIYEEDIDEEIIRNKIFGE